MASELTCSDGGSSARHHSPEINLSDSLADCFSPYPDILLDSLQNIPSSNDPDQLQLSDLFSSLYSSTPASLLSSSYPPTQKLHSLPLTPPAQEIEEHWRILNTMGVKMEFNADLKSDYPSLFSDRCNIDRAGPMQRSLSSQSLDRNPNSLFQPSFSSMLECPKIENQLPNLPQKFEGQIRRASSTGDLHTINSMQSNYNYSFSVPLDAHNSSSCIDEGSVFRVGRYSAEERKQKIDRYRSKRSQRNFNKTIKYACRKTLADSRPRVRGRFARNDETEEINKANIFHLEEHEEDLWVDRLNGEERELMAMRSFATGMSPRFQQFQYLGI